MGQNSKGWSRWLWAAATGGTSELVRAGNKALNDPFNLSHETEHEAAKKENRKKRLAARPTSITSEQQRAGMGRQTAATNNGLINTSLLSNTNKPKTYL